MDEFEWGYPNLATFQSSDEVFGLYRRFGYLQSRLLLEKQDVLRVLEKELNDYDEEDRAQSDTRKSDIQPNPREELLGKIEHAFNSYGKMCSSGPIQIKVALADNVPAALLTSSQQLMASNRPSASEYRNVCRYISQNKPLVRQELEYIWHKEDLVTLRPGRDHAWLDRSIEHFLRLQPFGFIKVCKCEVVAEMDPLDRHVQLQFAYHLCVQRLFCSSVSGQRPMRD